MKHFSLEEWADFVRGAGDDPSRAAMAAHLDAGCARCAQAVGMLQRTAQVMTADEQNPVPDHAIRQARAVFSMYQPQTSRLRRIAAQLLFDSAREPLPVGIRAQDRLTRRAMYAAGPFLVDLRFEQDPESPVLSLVGQLAARGEAATEPSGRPVLLTAGDDIVARTVTNRFGEFQMEYEPAPRLRLFVPLDRATGRIELPLGRLTSETTRALKGGKISRRAGHRPARGRAKTKSRE
jgi:hypothetical protein